MADEIIQVQFTGDYPIGHEIVKFYQCGQHSGSLFIAVANRELPRFVDMAFVMNDVVPDDWIAYPTR